MKYLKQFANEIDYQAFKESEDFVLPNVSFVIETKRVGFEPQPDNALKMVDLGLPSGLLWADRNVGAASPEDAGLYFQWGGTIGYTAEQVGKDKVFDADNYFDSTYPYKYYKGGLTSLTASDDAATVHMGPEYRIPTKAELEELVANTIVTFIDNNNNEIAKNVAESEALTNLKLIKFTGSTGKSILMPISGYCYGSSIYGGGGGYLWSSELNTTDSDHGNVNYLQWYQKGQLSVKQMTNWCGVVVRGVCSK